jgi:hypothetical protein
VKPGVREIRKRLSVLFLKSQDKQALRFEKNKLFTSVFPCDWFDCRASDEDQITW